MQKRSDVSLNRSRFPGTFRSTVSSQPQVRFERQAPELVTVQIDQRSCLPLISPVHRALFALGLDISSYRACSSDGGLVEHLVLERYGGGCIDEALNAEAKAAILPIAFALATRRAVGAQRDSRRCVSAASG